LIERPEALRNLADTDGASGNVGLELLHRFLGPSGPTFRKSMPGEHTHAVLHLLGRLNVRDRRLEAVARHVIGRDHHPNVEAVEGGAKRREALGR
jgi:hypothetical protein